MKVENEDVYHSESENKYSKVPALIDGKVKNQIAICVSITIAYENHSLKLMKEAIKVLKNLPKKIIIETPNEDTVVMKMLSFMEDNVKSNYQLKIKKLEPTDSPKMRKFSEIDQEITQRLE